MRRLRRPAVIVAIALGILVGTPGIAEATSANAQGHVYISQSEDCAWAQTHIDNVPAKPQLWTYASMDWWGPGGPCTATNALARAGTLEVSQDLLYFDFGDNLWHYCNVGAWYRNTTTTHDMMTLWNANFPCGTYPRWYKVNGYSGTWNFTWHPGYVTAGNVAVVQ